MSRRPSLTLLLLLFSFVSRHPLSLLLCGELLKSSFRVRSFLFSRCHLDQVASRDRVWRHRLLARPCDHSQRSIDLLAGKHEEQRDRGVHSRRYCRPSLILSDASPDLSSSTFLIYFAQDSRSRRLSSSALLRSLSSSSNTISISINNTLSSQTIRQYVAGVSDEHLYILSSGLEMSYP